MAIQKASKAMPFLTAPACQGSGLIGDAGFDPLYLSDFMDIKWMREAELKHGRIRRVCILGHEKLFTSKLLAVHSSTS